MKYFKYCLAAFIVASLLLGGSNALATEYDGTVKVGYQYLDTEGNRGVNQSTFNEYEGFLLSLERFSYRLDNGVNFDADIRSAALDNRSLSVGLSRTGQWGVSVDHNAYRRLYSFNGGVATKRYRTSGQFWWQAHRWFKLYGGGGITKKSGEARPLFAGDLVEPINYFDFSHKYYNVGVIYRNDGRTAQIEYRGAAFSDDEEKSNDRDTQRLRISASSPFPDYENLTLNAGYQYYRSDLEFRFDTLTAQTLWGGARFLYGPGYSLRYSFIFDRARRTGDLTETDNITHAVYVGKSWTRRGGVTLGYRYRLNDDARDERTGNGYYASGWYKPTTELCLRAGYGSEDMSVDAGHTLIGKTERSRGWASARYRMENWWLRIRFQNRMTDYDEIGSSADYMRLSGDWWLQLPRYASVTGSYSYGNGEYENTAGDFEYDEHIINGDIISTEYQNVTLGFGGTYLRSQRDLDIESFMLRFSGNYRFKNGLKLELEYATHNFDNLDDPSPIYTEYYTDNVVRIGLAYEL